MGDLVLLAHLVQRDCAGRGIRSDEGHNAVILKGLAGRVGGLHGVPAVVINF